MKQYDHNIRVFNIVDGQSIGVVVCEDGIELTSTRDRVAKKIKKKFNSNFFKQK